MRAALQAADNRGADVTTIDVPAGTYNLDPVLGALQVGLVPGETVSIVGSSSPTINQAPGCTETPALSCMVFLLDPSGVGGVTVSIAGLTIQGGHTANAGGGGGILGGSLSANPDSTTISDCLIAGNTATGGPAGGGGISYARGSLTVTNCAFNANHAFGGNGGAIDFADLSGLGSALNVSSSSFSSNTATAALNGGGGAIHLLGIGSTYTVTGSLFDGNSAPAATAPGGGGAVLKDSGTLTVRGSTFTGNSAGTAGAGGAVNSSSDGSNLDGVNRFAVNTAAAGAGQGIFRNTGNPGQVSAENNWWGTNTPNASDAAANVPLTRWIVLGLTASPGFVGRGGSTALTADLSRNNLGEAPGLVPNPTTIPVAWPAAALGAITGIPSHFLDAGAHASATYTADGVSGTGSASVRIDGQLVTRDILVLFPPTISKVFSTATVAQAGDTTLTFSLTNPNSVSGLSGVGFTDNLPAGLKVASPANGLAGSCPGGTITAIPGSSTISLAGATLAASGTCSFSVRVTGIATGTSNNVTGVVTSTEAGSGGTAAATIDVLGPPTISKFFDPNVIPLHGTTWLLFTVGNPATNAVALTGVAFTDHLQSGLTAADSSMAVCGGTASTVAATGIISLTGATIPAGGNCSFAVTVTGAASGTYTNTTSDVTSTNGGSGTSSTDVLSVVGPPNITKTFSAATVATGGTSTLTFTIDNLNPSAALSGVGFTDNLPLGLVVSTPNGLAGSCGGGTITALAGSSLVSLANANLAPSSSCSFSVSVTGTGVGVKNNKVSVTSFEGGPGNTSSATLTVVGPPSISKAFGAASVPLNGSTTLTLTITNPNPVLALTGVGVTDALPAGLVVLQTSSASACGGILTAVAGSGSVSLAGASLAPGASCLLQINVTGTTAGVKNNITGPVTSTEGGNGGPASASIVVVAPPSISKSFSPSSIAINATSALTFTITNPNPGVALNGVAFTDSLPAGLTVAGSSAPACGGTLTTAAPGTISLSGGSLPAGGGCTFTVSVIGTTSGNYTNTTGQVSSSNGGSGNTASANLLVASPPTITKSFGAASVPLNGSTALTFTVSNPNTTLALTGVAFSDSLPAGLVVAAPNGLSGSCGGGTITAASGSSTISLSGATLITAASCTFSVNVTGTTAGIKNNSVSVTSTEGGPGNTSNATLTVVAPPTISKAFGAASIPLNGSTSLTFTIANPNASSTLTGIGFVDTLPGGLVVASPSGVAGTCRGGVITALPGSSSVSLSGTVLAPNASCTFAVNTTATTAGSKLNTTGAVTSNEGGSGGTASANIVVVAPPSISKFFARARIRVHGSTVLTFTIMNPNGAESLFGVGFTDMLPPGLVISTPNGLVGSCGGGTIAATAATSTITLTGATLPANATCTFSVRVTGTRRGTYTNVTGAVTSTNGGTGNSATAHLRVMRGGGGGDPDDEDSQQQQDDDDSAGVPDATDDRV